MPGSSKHDKQVKAWQKRRISQADPDATQRIPRPRGNRADGRDDTIDRDRTPPPSRPAGVHPSSESLDRDIVSLPNRPEAWPLEPSTANETILLSPTKWQKFKSTLSFARWARKTYRSSKKMADSNGEPKAVIDFPSYSAEKNARRGAEGAKAATGGVVVGGTAGGMVLAILVWLRSIGVELPWPDSGDLGFATIVGGVLTPVGAYIAGRINNKMTYTRDAQNGHGA